MSVYVRWYNEVVEGEIEKENDLFGMTAVKIPIQGVTVIALFHPKNIFKTAQEACGEYPKKFTFDTWAPHIPDKSLSESIGEAIENAKRAEEDPDWLALQKFLKDHWNHERNMLQLDYWQEYDRMFFDYMHRKLQKDKPQQIEPMKIEHPETPEECSSFSKVIIPSTDLHDPCAFANNWLEAMRDAKIKVVEENSQDVKPRTIGKKVTVTELSLF